jgi:hypothetical protein
MSKRAPMSGRIMAHWSSRRQSTTTSSAFPCMSSTGRRNSAPMSTESGGRSLSPSCSQLA